MLGDVQVFLFQKHNRMKGLFLQPSASGVLFNLNTFLLYSKWLIDLERKEGERRDRRESRTDHPNQLLSDLDELSIPKVLQRQGVLGPP